LAGIRFRGAREKKENRRFHAGEEAERRDFAAPWEERGRGKSPTAPRLDLIQSLTTCQPAAAGLRRRERKAAPAKSPPFCRRPIFSSKLDRGRKEEVEKAHDRRWHGLSRSWPERRAGARCSKPNRLDAARAILAPQKRDSRPCRAAAQGEKNPTASISILTLNVARD